MSVLYENMLHFGNLIKNELNVIKKQYELFLGQYRTLEIEGQVVHTKSWVQFSVFWILYVCVQGPKSSNV